MRTSQERKPKGSRRGGRLLLAVFAGLAASIAAWQAPSLGGGNGFWALVLAIGLAVGSGLLARKWWYRTPFDISSRVPRQLSTRARVRWTQRPFLGWTVGILGIPRFAMGTEEDSVGVVGPTRVNKTRGIGIVQALLWGGPLVCISQTPILFRAVAARRWLLAKLHGGRILMYAPTAKGRVEGMKPVRFSPASFPDTNEITTLVESWMEASKTGQGVENSDHWRSAAGFLLRGLLYAASVHKVRPGDFTLVYGWLALGLSQDEGVAGKALAEPIQILRSLHTFEGDQWASDLEGVAGAPGKERGSIFSAARTTVKATANPTVLRSTTGTDFDPEEFLISRSTLFVVMPTEHQRSVAPLISMLVENLVHTAYRLHREGRLPARFGVSLDDLANVAPLPGLESHISQGGGQGVNVFWSLQSLAQLAVHYGEYAALAIWSATRCKIVFGGLTDDLSVKRLSEVLPEERVVLPGESDTAQGRRRSLHVTIRPLLSPAQLREIPDRWSLLLYHNLPPRMLHQPLAVKQRQTSRHMLPGTAAELEIEAAERQAAEAETATEVRA